MGGYSIVSFGAIKEKARSPYVLRWLRGCTRSSLSDERNDSTGVKSRRIKLDDNIEKGFLEKKKYTDNTVTDSSQSSQDELGMNASQFTASRFYTRRILRLRR